MNIIKGKILLLKQQNTNIIIIKHLHLSLKLESKILILEQTDFTC